MSYAYGEEKQGCDFGMGTRNQLKNTWKLLTAIIALMLVQLTVSGWAIKAANQAESRIQSQEVYNARLDERLQAIQKSLNRIEDRIEDQ